MKKIVFFLGVTLCWLSASQPAPDAKDAARVDALVDAIKQAPRPAAPAFKNVFYLPQAQNAAVSNTQEPQALKLDSIIGGKALILGRWRQVGDRVNGYLIEEIHTDYVILNRGEKEMKLAIETTSANRQILQGTRQ